MANGLLGLIAQPQIADIQGEFIRGRGEAQAQQELQRQQQARGLAGAALQQQFGGQLGELAAIDPALAQQVFQSQQVIGQARQEQFAEDVRVAANLSQDPAQTISFLDQVIQRNQQRGIASPQIQQFRDEFANDPARGAQTLQQLNQALQPTQQRIGDPVQSSQILGDGTTIQVLKSGSTSVTDPSGRPVTGQERVNAIATARREESRQQAARAGGRAAAVAGVEVEKVLTLEQVSKEVRQQLQLDKIKIDETLIRNAQDRQLAIDTKNIRRDEALNAASIVSGLIAGDRFSSAFGKVVTALPERLRPQESIDARAEVDQVISLLSLESRQKLKGQGTITDSEAKTLEKSATILANELISDDIARRELNRVRGIFESAAFRNQLSKESRFQQRPEVTPEAELAAPVVAQELAPAIAPQLPPSGRTGGVLNIDAQGNRAFVFPDGTFEEVQ